MSPALKETTFTPQSIVTKVSRGVFMAGTVMSAQPKCKCGGGFKQQKLGKYSVPVCSSCGETPEKLKVRRYLPGLDGTGATVDLRHDINGKTFEDVHDAIATLKNIDKELEAGTFDPRRYGSAKSLEQFKFKSFTQNYLEKYKGKITPGGYRSKEGTIRLYLMPYFAEIDMRNITAQKVMDFDFNFKGTPSQRNKAVQELTVILKMAFIAGLIPAVPPMPKTKGTETRDPENFLTMDEQRRVIEVETNPLYKKMFEILAIYGLRPCELRALQWGDLDFKDGVITIQRHFSDNNKIIPGRKKRKLGEKLSVLALPMIPRFLEIMEDLPRSINKDQFIFEGKIKDFVAQNVLSRHWVAACKKAGVKAAEMYEGTKHSRLSYLKSLGYSDEEIMLISGHTDTNTVKRYAMLTRDQKLSKISEMLTR